MVLKLSSHIYFFLIHLCLFVIGEELMDILWGKWQLKLWQITAVNTHVTSTRPGTVAGSGVQRLVAQSGSQSSGEKGNLRERQ